MIATLGMIPAGNSRGRLDAAVPPANRACLRGRWRRGIEFLLVAAPLLTAAAARANAQADPCATMSISAAPLSIPAQGGTVNLTITAAAACTWSIQEESLGLPTYPPNPPIVFGTSSQFNCAANLYSCASGTGNSAIQLTASANTSAYAAYMGICMWSLNDPCVDRVITFTEAGAGATVLKVGCSAGAGNVGLDYSSSLSAAGGTPPYTFSVSGSLPAGLTLNAAGGAISGTPTAAGASSFTVNAADAASNTGSAACTIVISAPCTAIIDGPADVPGLSAYKYAIDLPAAPAPTNIAWSVDQPTASLPGPTNLTSATVEFANTQADFITVLARFTLNGTQRGGTKQVALVKVDVGQAVFTTPGKADGVNDGSVYPFLVNAPPPGTGYVPSPLCAGLVVPLPPPGPFWVLPPLTPTATYPAPGMAWNCFVYDGPSQAAELQVREESDGAGGPAFLATCTVTLTSPAQKPTAQQNIQVGFIQHLVAVSGTASYPSKVSLNQNLTRIVTTPPTPTPTTVDWLSSTDSPPALNGDQWPWYDPGQRAACPAGNQSQVGKAPDTVNVVRYLSDVLAQHGFLVAFD